MKDTILKPDYLFEVSWEVCNKIGGIHTVISTKANILVNALHDNYICIGPDVWKETHGNPEFEEDRFLFRSWREQAGSEGIHIRIGRWKIAGEPIAMLVDFTPLFGEKDKIFTDLWLKFGLNSLSGQWDYTEPALFGYAAGQLIEHFYNYHLSASDRIAAHFHEWMTGSGVLYLNDKIPQAGTVFTTHATSLGRSLANNKRPLYSLLNSTEINTDALAQELGIVSRHSLEKLAANHADTFTTVSPGLIKECRQFLEKEPNIITPNGFDPACIPNENDYAEKRNMARTQLVNLAKGVINQNIPDNCMLVAISGRYEYHTKGVDLFIDALSKLNQSNPNNTIVAFILVPANQTGVRTEVVKRIQNPDYADPKSDEYITHMMVDEGYDPILQQLKRVNIHNMPDDKVKAIFVPTYLNGSDGVLNLNYYDLLTGFDLTVFPSYYEPWGYTSLESLAFHIPTITTSTTGFGQWVINRFEQHEKAITILDRDDDNYDEVVEMLSATLLNIVNQEGSGTLSGTGEGFNSLAHLNLKEGRILAGTIAESVYWDKLIDNYHNAYDLALHKANERHDLYKGKKPPSKLIELPPPASMMPVWKKIYVEINMPETFKQLPTLSRNLWWTWNYEAAEMFRDIDPVLWEQCEKNPNILLENLSTEHFDRLKQNDAFMKRYKHVIQKFSDYMHAANEKPEKQIAYFSMEYGLHESIKIYSGGLGVLAGDFLKQASDDNVNIVAVGLLYRFGYFSQNLSASGEQLATYAPHNFPKMSAQPVRDENGAWKKISIAFPGRTLHARIWKIDVGRIPLYLLDTDINENVPADRFITHQLYGGDWENRFKQEFLLGIGGIRLLDTLGLQPDVYHCNEGHAAFTGLERIRKYVLDNKLTFHEAQEVVRASSLFTTHTPVPAGHDFFSEDMLRTYMPHYAERLGISWDNFMQLGKMNPQNPEESFSMSVLAVKLSQQVNGVSRIHGAVSRDMFKDLYPGYFPEEIHIGYVTNGVHYGTWTGSRWQELYKNTFGEDFLHNISDPKPWEGIYTISDQIIWDIRTQQRKELFEYIKHRMLSNLSRRQETPRKIYQTLEAIDNQSLTIGFARRFATYKRAHLLFNDLERLSKIVNNEHKPVQIIFAGKAHPADQAGQDLIRNIVEISKRKEFLGKIVFLEDYDMELGAALTQGVDIWLNTPTRPLEASGTSGEKAVLNGVMNFSVMDGWWAEGYQPDAGWQLQEQKTYENQVFQDELDAETIYNTLETEIVPMFYERDENGIPVQWVQWIKNNIAKIAPHFTNKRMMDDYFKQYYSLLFESSDMICKNEFSKAREISRWKSHIIRGWDSIEVISKKLMSNSGKSIRLGELFKAELTVDLNELSKSDFGVEVVFTQKNLEGLPEIKSVYEMDSQINDQGQVIFSCEIPAKRTGKFNYAFRMFPNSDMLPHRQDFALVKWL